MRRIPRPSPATVIALIALVVAVGGTAYATGEGKPILGGARNPGNDQSKSYSKETEIIASNSSYGTRQSNKSKNGGGAIYGCRSGAGGTAKNNEPCIRANNLEAGLAFELVTTKGDTAGLIQTKDSTGKPFTTNANGVATGLNADRVDSLDADQIVANARAGLNPLSKMSFVSPSTSNADEGTARASATEIALTQFGPFSLYAKCFVDSDGGPAGTPLVFAEVYARTTQDTAVLDGQTDNLTGNPAYLNITTPEVDRQVDTEDQAVNGVSVEFDDDLSALMASDGSAFEFHVDLVAKNGALPGGDGPYGGGERCGFGFSRFGAS